MINLLSKEEEREFKKFLKENVKSKVFNFDAYLDDLETQ